MDTVYDICICNICICASIPTILMNSIWTCKDLILFTSPQESGANAPDDADADPPPRTAEAGYTAPAAEPAPAAAPVPAEEPPTTTSRQGSKQSNRSDEKFQVDMSQLGHKAAAAEFGIT